MGFSKFPARVMFLLALSVGTGWAEVRVTGVEGDAELIHGDAEGSTVPLAGGEILAPDDRIVTGMDSAVSLAFGGDSSVVVRELTDVKIAEFLEGSDEVRTRLWLKAGQVSADLLHQGQARSDFAVKTPTATCSVRGSGGEIIVTPNGTQMSVRHGTFAMNTDQGETTNGQGQQSRGNPDGEIEGDDDIRNQDSSTPVLPGGASDAEQEGVEESGSFLTNTGAGAPGDDGSIAGNDTIDSIEDVIEGTALEDLFEDPKDDGDDGGDGGGMTPLGFRVVAKTGDFVPDRTGAQLSDATFDSFAFDPNSPAAFGVEAGSGQSTIVFKGKGQGTIPPTFTEGVFYSVGAGQVKALAHTTLQVEDPGDNLSDPNRTVRFDGFLNTKLAVDGPSMYFSANVTFFTGTAPYGPAEAIFRADATGNLFTVADTRFDNPRGAFSRLYFGIPGAGRPEYSVDGGNVVFVGEKVINPGPGQFVQQQLHKGDGFSAPIDLGVSTQAGTTFQTDTHGAQQFLPPGTGPAFRNLAYSESIVGGQVAFVGHFTGGEGVFVHTIGGGTKPIADSGTLGIDGSALLGTDGLGAGPAQFFKDVALEGSTLAFIAQSVIPSIYEGIYRVSDVTAFDPTVDVLPKAVVDTRFTYSGPTGDRQFVSFQNVALDNGKISFTGSTIAVGGGALAQGIYREQDDGSFQPVLEHAVPGGTPLDDVPGIPDGIPGNLVGVSADQESVTGGGVTAVVGVELLPGVLAGAIVTSGGPGDMPPGGGTVVVGGGTAAPPPLP